MRPRIRSVRLRATIGASAVVMVALVIAAVTLTTTLRSSQTDAIDNALELRAIGIESLIDGGASLTSVAVQSDEDGLVQIIDASGRVVASSDNIDGEPPLTTHTGEATSTRHVAAIDDEPFRVRVHPTDGARRYTIIVGSSLEDLERNQDVLIGALAIGIPILLLIIAALVLLVVGRALHPVEAIRSRVAAIGGHDLDQRVPVPDSDDEIGRLAVTMNEMLDRLEDANERQARFVSDASHELRTPIAVIRHELEVALAAHGDDALEVWRATGEDLLEEDLRMQRLVEDLLYMARRDQRNSLLDLGSAQLIDLDDLVLDEIHRRPNEKHVDVAGVSAGQVRGDPERVARVVRNLVDNAQQHAATRVSVAVTSAGGVVTLTVDDDGPGVAAEHIERVFERFGRADDARGRDDGGSGLGLAIVRDIVTDHGGNVTVERSEQLGGAAFIVTLPDARDTAR